MFTERFRAQLLSGKPAVDVPAVVGQLLAVQSQELRGARLAVRVRSAGTTANDVDRALTTERSLVVSWLNRGTLHLVRTEDYWWLHQLTAPHWHAANARRLAQEGLSGDEIDRGVVIIKRALGRDGPLTREQLRSRLQSGNVQTEGQALIHLLFRSSLLGHIVRGPIVGREQAFVLVDDWLTRPPPIDRQHALSELARRYLIGHGPAEAADLARWSGLPLGEMRAAMRSVAAHIEQGEHGYTVIGQPAPPTDLPPTRLLGPFDPVLFGWRSRTPILGSNTGVVTTNGIFRSFVLAGGQGVATWSSVKDTLTVQPFAAPLRRRVIADLTKDAGDLRRFLGNDRPFRIVIGS